jgi:ribosomal protein S18 acetylase RimI-like enzyme
MLRLPPMPEVTGNKAAKANLYREVARIHAAGINQGFLHTLGESFLALLYEAIDSDPSSALFIEQEDGKVVGFVTGGRGMGTIYRQMFKRWPRLLLTLLPTLLNVAKLKRVLEVVWYSRQQKPVPGCPDAELLSIAVLESARGRGTAQRLYQELVARFLEEGEVGFCIVVGQSLAPAHRFYQRLGAVPMAQVAVHHGQISTLYRHDLRITH